MAARQGRGAGGAARRRALRARRGAACRSLLLVPFMPEPRTSCSRPSARTTGRSRRRASARSAAEPASRSSSRSSRGSKRPRPPDDGSLATALAVAAGGVGGGRTARRDGLTPNQLAGQRVVPGSRACSRRAAPAPHPPRQGRRRDPVRARTSRAAARSRAWSAAPVRAAVRRGRPAAARDGRPGGRTRPADPGRARALRRGHRRRPAACAPRAGRARRRRDLRRAGVNFDLAPVVDVARPGSAMERERRAYGRRPAKVARFASAFASGLRRAASWPPASTSPASARRAPTRTTCASRSTRRASGCGASTSALSRAVPTRASGW